MASQHASPTEETPLLVEADGTTTTTTSAHDQDDVAQTVLSPIRACVAGGALAISMLVHATNMTMVTTSQSAIAGDLDAFSDATWLTASYLIAVASLTPLGGRLCQIFPLRGLLAVSNVLSAVGLMITGTAQTLPFFLLGRAVTGLGGAGVYSTQIILVLELASKKRRGLFIGLIASIFTVGLAGGAILAGAVTPTYGWRLIYYIQSPLILLAGLLIYIGIPSKARDKETISERASLASKLARLDYLGILTLTTANIVFLYSVSCPVIPYPLLLISGTLYVLFIWIESSPSLAPEPIIPVAILRSRGVLFTSPAVTGQMMARWTVVFYTPVYGIAVRGWNPAQAGTMLIPTNIGFGMGGLVVGWLHIRKSTSYYTSCLVLYALFVTSLLSIVLLSTSDSSVLLYIIAVFYNGFCAGALLNYTTSHVLHLTLPSAHFIATSVIATFRAFASSFGSAIGGGVFTRVLKSQLEAAFHVGQYLHGSEKDELIRRLLGSPALVWQLEGYERDVAIAAYQSALRTTFLAAMGLVVVVTVLQAGTGWKAPVDDVGDAGVENVEDDMPNTS